VEIKARVKDPAALQAAALALGDGPAQIIKQRDTFYRVPRGRLKLRVFADGTGELIAYDRPNQEGPKTSRYAISPTSDPERLHAALSLTLGVRGVVSKQRTLVMSQRTRIHLDHVLELGDFMELEVVLADDESEADGMAVARDLMAKLGIATTDLVQGAYLDLLEGF
jgi:adenylate cyclase